MRSAHTYIARIFLVALAVLSLAGTAAVAEPAGISSDQRDQLRSLASQIRDKSSQIRGELMSARHDLLQAYRSYDLDEKKARSAMDRIGKAQLSLLNMHLENQISLRRILNADQFARFQDRMRSRTHGHMLGGEGMEDGMFGLLPGKDSIAGLDLTAEQANRLKSAALWPERRRAMDRLRRDSSQILGIYSDYDLDAAAAKKLIAGIHKGQLELAALNYKGQVAIRTILTPAQFQRLWEKAGRLMHDRPRRGPKA